MWKSSAVRQFPANSLFTKKGQWAEALDIIIVNYIIDETNDLMYH